jgi:hypothetical protein
MANIDLTVRARPSGGIRLPALVCEVIFGFVYWLLFLLVLEPDNILRAMHMGGGLVWTQELLRITAASTLGAAITPLLLVQVRRFPIEGNIWWRNAVIQVVGSAIMAAGLIVVGCLLADRFLASEHRPLARALGEEFVANWTLLVFCIAGFVAIAHAVRFFLQIKQLEQTAASASESLNYLVRVPVKARGRTIFVELANVDWIETQGNYLALHVGPTIHLIRESLARLEPRLNPEHFARVHRRTIVAVDRIREITSLGAGDASLRLKDGTEIRLSRGFRDRLGKMVHQQ